MTDLAKHHRADEGILMPGQSLTESWEITYTRRNLRGKIEARLSWPNVTNYLVYGEGATVEEARLNLVLKVATEIAHDDDPHNTSPEAREGFELAAEAARAAASAPTGERSS